MILAEPLRVEHGQAIVEDAAGSGVRWNDDTEHRLRTARGNAATGGNRTCPNSALIAVRQVSTAVASDNPMTCRMVPISVDVTDARKSFCLIEQHDWIRRALKAKSPVLVIDEYQDLGLPLHLIVVTHGQTVILAVLSPRLRSTCLTQIILDKYLMSTIGPPAHFLLFDFLSDR